MMIANTPVEEEEEEEEEEEYLEEEVEEEEKDEEEEEKEEEEEEEKNKKKQMETKTDEKQSVFKQVHMPTLTADQGFQPSFGVLAILGLCALFMVRHLQHLYRHYGEQITCLCPSSRLGEQTEQT